MLRSDFVVHNEVRRELVRTQASLEKIQFGVTRGVVYFGAVVVRDVRRRVVPG